MKLYIVDFDPMWPVPCGLVILAENMENAEKIANEKIQHRTRPIAITEVDINTEGVVFYESGDY